MVVEIQCKKRVQIEWWKEKRIFEMEMMKNEFSFSVKNK